MATPSTSPLAKFLWGEDRLQRRIEIIKVLSNNPLFNTSINIYSLSRKDLWHLRAQQSKELIDLRFKLGWSREKFLEAINILGEPIPAYPQFRIFMKNLESQMSPEQQEYWIPKANKFEIFGCYAQTELGHGSNLHGIETTATFDRMTDEFVMNSPTLSSTKFWIGTLGCWATHAIVVARLIIEDKELGNHLFLVQVRDLDTHDLLPDISIYDQGEKAMGGLGGVDNGAMRFFHKRIPRSQMFAGAASVTRDGIYLPAKNRNHSFTSMVIIRGMLSDELGIDMAKALFIATKYAGFRRQFGKTSPDGQETRVIDYNSVKYRLYPSIARAVTLMLNGREISETVADKTKLVHDLEDLHLQTVGGKVYASEHSVRAIDMARLVCGGHGTLASAALGQIYATVSPSRTYEGDSYVISLQIGRAIVKHWNAGTAKNFSALTYLQRLCKHDFLSAVLEVPNPAAWFDAKVQYDAIEQRVAILAWRHLEDTKKGKDTSYDVLELTMAHSDLNYWRGLQNQLKKVPTPATEAMKAVAMVFTLTTIREGLSTFAGHKFISVEAIEYLRNAQEQALQAFIPHLETILDAYSFTDFETKSTLCKSDASPYEAIMDVVRKSVLNDSNFIKPTAISARSLWKKYDLPKL